MTLSANKSAKKLAVGRSVKASPKDFIDQLSLDYPAFKFKPGTQEHWSPKTNTITYNPEEPINLLRYGFLHELAHAQLGHIDYEGDFELLKLEAGAWELAAKIGKKYNVVISQDHIQNCLDTYRDWLHQRSACPTCGMRVLQKDSSHYHCFNCQTQWKVTSGRFVRPYKISVAK